MGGTFFVIDGPDGSGKSTLAARLAAHLRERGDRVLVLREPGATPAGEAIREILLHADVDLTPLTEMLLYQAARAQIVETVIRPALEEGQTIVLDRYWYSTAAYQGYGLGIDPEWIRRVSAVATGGLEPDHVFVLDLDPEVGLARLKGRPDRIEGRSLDYHRRVREGFRDQARALGAKATLLDAGRTEEEVAAELVAIAERIR